MIVRFAPAVALSMLFAANAALADSAIRVVLRASAVVAGADYALGEIADFDGGDPATRARLSELIVGKAPRQGYTDAVGRMQLATYVRQQSGVMDVVWDGADQIRIRGAGQRVAAERLSDAAVRALYGQFAGQYTTIALRPVGATDGINVPAGKVELDARVPAPRVLARRMSALVDVRVDGKFYTTTPVWFAVEATRPALVARATLQPGEALHAEDFETKNVEVTAAGSRVLGTDDAIDALRVRHPVGAGMALAAANVESKPSVARADTVAVRVVHGAVTIETAGVALADARVGETIKVKNASSGEIFAARVVGPGAVLVSTQ